MKLNPGERSIMAYFPSSTKAEAAMADLKSAGIGEMSLDRVSRYGVDNNREINNPIAGQAETITGLTLFSADTDHFNNNDARVLMAADPSVSGYTRTEGYGLGGGKSFLVAIVTSEEKVDEAVGILKQHGAEV